MAAESPSAQTLIVRGLYAVTDEALIGNRLLDSVRFAIEGGARIVQYRNKHRDAPDYREKAAALAALCRRLAVPLIVNDDPHLASEVDAQGVHLGAADPSLAAAREVLGPARCIGVSCYNDIEHARIAQQAGCDYVAFGRFFPSATKPAASGVEPGLLRRARQELSVPIVAIGGINADNGGQLLAAGADSLAVVHAVFGQSDIRAAADAIARLFAHTNT